MYIIGKKNGTVLSARKGKNPFCEVLSAMDGRDLAVLWGSAES